MSKSAEILRHLSRNVDTIIGEADLVERLESGRPLRIKYGVDCTAPDMHIGHAVNLWMMRYLQDLGHRVAFLLGDLTTQIGDPTGKSSTRPVLDAEAIEANAAAFLDQVSMVLSTDPDVFEVRRNSEWFGPMPAAELLGLFSMVTHAQLMARDMFRDRIEQDREIALHELTYPVLQGYDSVALQSDLTIVGSDQLFNEMMGRHYQERMGVPPQVLITTTITPGLDGGPKQSKSLSNYVALTDTPENKFGKIMSLSDDLIGTFTRAYTDLDMDDVQALSVAAAEGGKHARDAKLRLAGAIVARYHGEEEALRQSDGFRRIFSDGGQPDDLPGLSLDDRRLTVHDLLARAEPKLTNGERRRLVAQGGVRINGVKLARSDEWVEPRAGTILRIGKRRWHRIELTVTDQSR